MWLILMCYVTVRPNILSKIIGSLMLSDNQVKIQTEYLWNTRPECLDTRNYLLMADADLYHVSYWP